MRVMQGEMRRKMFSATCKLDAWGGSSAMSRRPAFGYLALQGLVLHRGSAMGRFVIAVLSYSSTGMDGSSHTPRSYTVRIHTARTRGGGVL